MKVRVWCFFCYVKRRRNLQDNFILDLTAALKMAQSKKQVNSDIKELEKVINTLRITGVFAKANTKKELNAYIKQLETQLSTLKLKAKIDDRKLKHDIDQSLNNMTFKDIDVLNVDENKAKLKVRKAFADIKAYASKNTIPVNLELKKEKLQNQLTTFLNKNSKISESSALLKEADHVRELIDTASDSSSLRDATDAFQLYKSEVSATGYATKSTTERVKDMISHITKIGSAFGVASLAVNQFRKSLSTLKSNDTILTEISKTSEMTQKQLSDLGNESFKTANKFGQLSSNYLLGVQEMARSGYENLSKELGELSLLAQSAGDMTAENANNYLLATDAAYKYQGSVEKLTAALDGANFISNRNSASLTDIADATSVSASFAANAGVAIDQLTAAEATMIATTKRSGSEMGRAFRSIILNLQQVSGEFDGEVIDEEQLAKVEERCHSLGVELEYVKDGIATLRNPMDVLKDLADVYNSLPDNSADKQGLISDIGGKYHANALSSLLSRWDLYEKMLSEFSQGSGSALEEAAKTADSWEGRLNRLQNSWDSFVNSLTNKTAITGGISFLDNMIQGAESLVDTLGEIPVALTAVTTAMVALNKDMGITQLINPETKKMDVQGNLIGLVDITAIKAQKKHMEEAGEAIAGWNRKLLQGQTDINKFSEAVVQNNTQLKAYLATTSKDAPASLNGYKAYLNASGEATDALRLKTVLLNSAISFGLGIAIQLAVKGITTLIRRNEELAENVDELMSSYKMAISTANDNAQTIEGLADRYETLSKGVNKLGENVSLTTDEYEEYNDIVNQIADMFPNLITGYTNEGNAILSLKGNVEQLRDTYKEAQKEAYNLLLISGEDADGNDILKMWKNTQDSPFLSKMFDFGKDDAGKGISTADAIEQLEALSRMSAETYRNIEKATSAGTREQITALSDIEKEIGYGSFISKALGIDGNVSDEDFEVARKEAKSLIQTYTAEIESALSNVQTLANAYLMTNDDYEKLDVQAKNAASILVNGIDEAIANGFTSKNDVGTYVLGIVNSLRDNTDFRDAIVNLLSLDYSDMPINEAKATVDSYIDIIADELNRDPLELKVQFGLVDIDSVSSNYQTVLNKAAQKFSGQSFIVNGGSKLYDEEKKALEKFAEENSINTQDEIAFWNKCIEESSTREEAMQKYLESKFDSLGDDASFNISAYKDQIDDFQSSTEKLSEALQKIKEGDLSDSDLLDLQQEFPQLTDESDNLSDAINDLIDESLQSLVETLEAAGASDELITLVRNVAAEAMNSDDLNSSIDSLQSAYSTLSDAIKEYNSTGTFTLDTLQTLLSLEPQYLNCLMTENGQLALNEQALAALANQRLDDAEAQAVQNAIEQINTLTEQANAQAKDQNAASAENAMIKMSGYNAVLSETTTQAITAAGAVSALNQALDGASVAGVSQEDIGNVMGTLDAQLKAIDTMRNKVNSGSVGGVLKTKSSSGSSGTDAYKEAFEKELSELQYLRDKDVISETEYYQQLKALNEKYFAGKEKYLDEYRKYEVEVYNYEKELNDKIMDDLQSSMDELQSSLKTLQDAQEQIRKFGAVSIDTLQEMLQLEPQYLAQLSDENGQISINEESFRKLAAVKVQEMQITYARQAIDLINTLTTEAKAAEWLAGANAELTGTTTSLTEALLQQAVAAAHLRGEMQGQAADTILQAYNNAKQLVGMTDFSIDSLSGEELKTAEEEFEELIDFFERRVNVLDNAFDLLKTNINNVVGSAAKNTLIDAQSGIIEERFKNYSDALNMYNQKANEALSKLDGDLQEKIKNGAVDLTTFVGEGNEDVVEAIKDYE